FLSITNHSIQTIYSEPMWCREGRAPPRAEARRILSPFSTALHSAAPSSIDPYKSVFLLHLYARPVSHRIAPNRTKFQYKPAPKPAPRLALSFVGLFKPLRL